MQKETNQQTFPPLEDVSKPLLTVGETAHYLNRKPQTVRSWLCKGISPIKPVRIHNKPNFRTSDVRALVRGND